MINYCGGDKGGTGKSLMAMLATHYFHDYYIRNGRRPEDRPMLLDTDRTNPNVWEVYKGCPDVDATRWNLAESEGWEQLVDLPDMVGERPIIINSGSTDIEAIGDMRTMLSAVPGLVIFWVINTEADSIDLLGKFLDVVEGVCVVIKNEFFGNRSQFTNFDLSQYAKNGMKSVYLPKASPSLIHIMYSDRIPLHAISDAPKEKISIGKKAAAKMWCDKAAKVVPEALLAALGPRIPWWASTMRASMWPPISRPGRWSAMSNSGIGGGDASPASLKVARNGQPKTQFHQDKQAAANRSRIRLSRGHRYQHGHR